MTKANQLIEQCEQELQAQFKHHEQISLFNQEKVLNAFQKHRLASRHFVQTNGYG